MKATSFDFADLARFLDEIPSGLADAKWIGIPGSPAPAVAKTFWLPSAPVSATLAVTGVGFYEAWINGARVGRKVLDPAPTDYTKRVFYSTYDIAAVLRPGENEIRILLGNGWFNVQSKDVWKFYEAPWRDFPRAIAALEIALADGARQLVATDSSWRAAASPVAFNDIREGEVVLARASAPPASMSAVREVPAPAGTLVPETHPGAEVVREYPVVRAETSADGSVVFDFGSNITGWARIRFRGLKEGVVAVIRYDERHPSEPERRIDLYGKDFASVRECPLVNPATAGFQTDRFVSAGGSVETYEPRFTYSGFRYVTVHGADPAPRPEDVTGCFVRTAFPKTGKFSCSDETFNRLVAAAELSYEGNFTDGIPTDCPHREKNGWLGDAGFAVEFAQYAYGSEENSAAYRDWVRVILDQQRGHGPIGAIVPTAGWGHTYLACSHGPAWGAALTTIPTTVYRFRGDREFLAETWPGMRKYVDKLLSEMPDGICRQGLGDWCSAKGWNPERWWEFRTPVALTSTAFAYRSVRELAFAAGELGRDTDAARYSAEAEAIRRAFHAEFSKGNGVYGPGIPCAQAVPLEFGLVPEDEIPAARRRLVEAVHAEGDTIDFGVFGVMTVFRQLSEAGEGDLAWKLIMHRDKPGFANWIERGATTLWENFEGDASLNHVFFADFVAWAYAYVAGVRPLAPGFRRFDVRPRPPSALRSAATTVPTPHGAIRVAWERCGGEFHLQLHVPAGTHASVMLPDGTARMATDGDNEWHSAG